MATDVVDDFETELVGTAEECVRTTADGVADAVADQVEPPAVGVPLPFEGASLPDDVTVSPDADALRAASTGVTPGGLAIADYGTVTVQSRAAGDELVGLYPERHVAVVAASDVVRDMPAAFERLAEQFAERTTTHVLETGPSTTADMGTLVEGVHGPTSVRVVVVEDR